MLLGQFPSSKEVIPQQSPSIPEGSIFGPEVYLCLLTWLAVSAARFWRGVNCDCCTGMSLLVICLYLLMNLLSPNYWQIKSNLSDVIQIYQQGKARQLSVQSEAITPVPYPEYILPYLVHALAHHSSFPNIDECKDVKVFEPTYRYKCFQTLLMVACIEV